MIPIGVKCEECGKIHLIKSMDELGTLSPHMRAQVYRSEHRVFRDGYSASLDVNDEVHEFYLPLSIFKIERIQEEEPEKTKTDLEKYVEEIYEVEQEEDE